MPWAFTWPISPGFTPASARAASIAREIPLPVVSIPSAAGSDRVCAAAKAGHDSTPRRSARSRVSITIIIRRPFAVNHAASIGIEGRHTWAGSDLPFSPPSAAMPQHARKLIREPVPPKIITSACPRRITWPLRSSPSSDETSPSQSYCSVRAHRTEFRYGTPACSADTSTSTAGKARPSHAATSDEYRSPRFDPFHKMELATHPDRSTSCRPRHDAEPLGIQRRFGQSRILPRQLGRGRRQLNIARHHLDALRGWISSLGSKSVISPPNGASQPAAARSGSVRTPLRARRCVPHRLPADADRRDNAQTGDDNFPLSHVPLESSMVLECQRKNHGRHAFRTSAVVSSSPTLV